MSGTPNLRARQPVRDSEASTPAGGTTLTTRLPIHPRFPSTPSRFTASTTPLTNRSSRWTPGNRGGAPSTPHGLRAMQRRAANTPGRERRKSGRGQRESVFDVLRNLSKALAPESQPIRSSPQAQPEPESESEIDEIDELDNETPPERPRLSLPLEEVEEDDDDDGSPEIRPPRMSLALEDDDMTHTSVEYPRRATFDRDRPRLSMMSYGATRLDENFGDATGLESDSDAGDFTGIIGDEDGEQDETIISQSAFDRGGETEDLGRFNFEFNFPSPNAPVDDLDADGPTNDDEGFELPAIGLEPGLNLVPDDSEVGDATGDSNVELNLPSRVSMSESPGFVGGGVRDEEIIVQGSKQKKLSRHGIPVPNMPAGVVRKLATRFARARAGPKAKVSKTTLAAIEQASSWYFEQASEDLAAYSKHAGRKTIDEADVTALMRRQRHLNNTTTVFSLAQKHLPKELLQDMRLPMPPR
ncbi:centromere kinetochore component CENP-T-domain-containing protein [Aspergillus cavernicola]|uniref:Centromere kinetochore component CENP-T-domain-containing protein n=1 Tax=Aspergillus cavernicola TaxID=176166 RepID=A0ABR4ITY7_9EURO